MVDDTTRRDELQPGDEPDVTDEDEDERPIVVTLNPTLDRVSGQRLLGLALILGGAVSVGFLIFAFITLNEGVGPTKGFEGVVLLLAGFVTVGLLLYLGTLLHRGLDMGAPHEALGMPEGSVRALIAMSLILIFAIIGVQVFAAGAAGAEVMSTGLTQAQIDALRADGALVIAQSLQTPVPAPPAEPLYTVTTRTSMTQEAHDFGLQLMTTVSTLVVAVAGFYFGSRAVSQASMSVQEQLRLARSYSRRGTTVVGARPEPNVATEEEAPGENIGDELGPAEEGEEPVDDALAKETAADTETAKEPEAGTEGQAGSDVASTDKEPGADGDDGDDDGQDLDADDTEPEATTVDENGEPPAQQPGQPPQPGLP